MSIYIKENEKPNLVKCIMNCDDDLHERLNKYDLTSFMNTHTMNLMIGRPKSGKSSLLYSFFKSKKLFYGLYSKIYYFAPENSRASMNDNIFESLPENQKFNELSFENLSEVMDRIKADAKEDYTSCILFDDMGAYLKKKDTLKLFKELAMNKRHLKTSTFFCVQTWYSVEKDIRRLWDNIFIFRVSKDELTNIFDEAVELDKSYVVPISNLVFDKKYEYLFINIESRRMFN